MAVFFATVFLLTFLGERETIKNVWFAMKM